MIRLRVCVYVSFYFYLVKRFNYPLVYVITLLWNGGGPNKQASLHCAPRQFGIGSIGVYFCNGVARCVGTSSKIGRDTHRRL